MSGSKPRTKVRPAEAGFTLIEAMISVVVLVVGVVGVSNLMLVSASANKLAHAGTGAAAQATEVMERLKAIPFNSLTAGGSLTSDAGSALDCNDNSQDCAVGGNFNARRDIPGVGRIRTRWRIVSIDSQTMFLTVRAQADTLLAAQTRAEYTTFRSCTATSQGCPF